MHVREQHAVDFPEPRVVRAAHRAADVVEDARAVRVLEDERAVEGTELAVVASHGCDLHRAGGGAAAGCGLAGGAARESDHGEHEQEAHHVLLGFCASGYYVAPAGALP